MFVQISNVCSDIYIYIYIYIYTTYNHQKVKYSGLGVCNQKLVFVGMVVKTSKNYISIKLSIKPPNGLYNQYLTSNLRGTYKVMNRDILTY